jgi:predicted RNA-binding protein with TRAM domain
MPLPNKVRYSCALRKIICANGDTYEVGQDNVEEIFSQGDGAADVYLGDYELIECRDVTRKWCIPEVVEGG